MRKRYSDSRDSRGIWRRTVLAGAVAACFAGNTALANPTGPAVTQGQASFATQGNTLTVTNAPGTVINWQGFSIAGSEITRFIQQSQMSAVLNRVVGVNPSAILGTLQSNGRVYLVNPNGITVGPGANIDVAGFLASTLNLSDGDFLSGRMRFTESPGAAAVVNAGTITTATGGMVYLVGRDVQNSGIIRSPQGEILLAAGKSIELVDAQTPEVRVELTAPDNQVLNVGQLIAAGGRIGMYGTLVTHSGVASANTAVMGENGKIVFKAIQDVTLDAGSVTTASGPQGGSVTVQAETGTLLVSGTIEAKGDAGKGGTIQLTGDRVGLIGNATIDASGLTGGGSVLVGGDFQGGNAEVPNAWRTYVGAEASIKADAMESGDGGKVIVWADDITRAYGTISARGGPQGGDGGFVEVSGKNQLDFAARVDASAPAGAAGTLLLDPTNITVANAGGATTTQVDEFADAAGGTLSISPATLNAAGTTVVLQATQDITVNDAVNLTTVNAGFVAQAGRHIDVNAPITTNGGRIHLEADSPHSGQNVGDLGIGIVRIDAAVNSNGGTITLIGGGNSNPNGGGFELNAEVNAGIGGINVSLTQTGALDFFIGAGGNTQLSSNDTGSLKTTGALVLGKATSAGTDGLGTGVVELIVDSLTNTTANSIQLSSESGSSFELYAGDGGIDLGRPLTTFQDTVINTTGPLQIDETLGTSGNDLSITASSVTLGSSGSINTGDGAFTCTGTGCTALTGVTGVFWDGGGNDLNWFNPLNWFGDAVPDGTKDVTIETALGPIVISGGDASAKSLITLQPLTIESTGSLNLTNASTFSDELSLSGGSLLGTGLVSVSGPSGSLVWSSGTMGPGGTFLLTTDRSGTLIGTLTLNRLFQNDGTLTLNAATISGTGSITNNGTLTAASGTSNTINDVGLSNSSNALISVLGTLTTLTATQFPQNDGVISVGSGGVFDTGGAALANSVTSSIIVDGGNFSTDGNAVTTVGGNLMLTGALSAGKVMLSASGNVTLDTGSSITATSSDDSIVISGDGFINNAGAAALDPGAGRWLVYSTNPAGNTFGSLVSGNKAIWGRSYPTAVSETGNRYVFADAGAVTVTTTDASKTYGNVADVSSNYVLSGDPLNAAGYGNVFIDATLSDVFASGPTISSAGSVATASVAGGPYSISGTGTANSGFSLTFDNSGLLTVNKADFTSLTGTKTYDGSALFASGQLVLTGVNSETFTLSSATADSANATANGGATTFVSAGTVTGGGNYNALNLGVLTTNTATINRADYTALTGTKTYDGSALFASGQLVLTGVNSEILTLSSATADSANASLNGGATTFVSAGTVTGGGNYNALNLGALTPNMATINQAALSVTANSTAKTYGQTVSFNGTEFISSGLQNSETIGTVTLTSAGAAPTAGVAGSPYAITPSLATGGTFAAGNYTITYNNGTLTVSPAVIGLAGMREYDGTTSFAAGTFGSINGVNGETLALSGSGTVASPKVLAGTQALTLGTLTLGNGTGLASNYTLTGGAHTGTITASVTFPFVWDLSSAVDLSWDNPANWNQGAVPLNGATASIPSGLAGPVVYSGASGTTGLTTLSSGSGFTITGGTLTLGNSVADVSTFSGRPLTLNGGTLDGAGTISLVGTTLDVLAGGVLGGSRTIIGNVNNLAGTVSPGASPGTMTIDGNYLQGSSGTLLAEIGGLAAGTQYDRLVVSGTVTLDGNLNVVLDNGFIPAAGDTFTIVESGGGVSGTFATTSLPSAPSMQVNLLASSVNVATSGTLAPVDTAQLISFQINQIDASLTTETDMSKFIVVTDPITNETFVTVGAVEIAVSGGTGERAQKPGVCR